MKLLHFLLLLLAALALALSIPADAQFAPGGIGGSDSDSDSGEGSSDSATGGADGGGGDGPPVNNGAFDLPPSSTGAGFGWQLPDYPPQNVTWKQGECQFVPKWPGPRCPAGYECMSERLSKRMHDGTIQLSYRQEHCVFCAATEFCTNEQKDACKDLEVLTDFETFSLINETAGVGNCSPCKEGQYCPSGASNPFGLAIVNLCAEGWVCPVSDKRERCPVGFFCPYGTKFPLACTVTGTFCPLGSSDFDKPCPGGSYCPNPQTRIQCPSGHFCKAGSVVPKKCQAMASCPAGSAAALIVWQGILEVVALYVGFALIYYGVIYLQRRRRKREQALVAKRSEGKEVAELLKSLKSFQNLEIREGFSPRQARIRAESAVLEGAAGAAAADRLRKVKLEQELQDGDVAAAAAAAETADNSKEEREPGEKSDDDELQHESSKASSNTTAAGGDAETSAARAAGAAGAAALGAAAAAGTALASQRKASGAVDPKQVSIVLPAAEQQLQHVQGANGTPGGNYAMNGAAVSTDGTPLPNSRPLPNPLPLKSNAAVAFGDEFDGDSSDDEHDELEGFDPIPCPVTISFDQLGLKLKNGAEILKGVSGVFPHSRLTALMGPSGSGKSTFLNVLCGKATYGTQTGSIKLNGVETTLSSFKSLVGFVPQDDVLHGDLTCYENLYYNAMLRLPRSMPTAQKQRIVDDTIRMLGLEAVQHSVVGSPEARGISGGQRKRCNIGIELVAWPTLLFMDEPTSGLDSTASLEVLSALRDLTALGISIVTVIHQPRFSIVELFHSMLLLGKGGQTVFLGNSEQALNYFSDLGFQLPPNENPADFFLDVISGEVRRDGDPDFQPKDLYTLWEQMGEWVRRDELEPPAHDGDDAEDGQGQAQGQGQAEREFSRSHSDVEPHFIYVQPRTPAGHLMSPHSEGARMGSGSAPPPALNVLTPSHLQGQGQRAHFNPLSTRTNQQRAQHGPQRSLSLAAGSGSLVPHSGAGPQLPPAAGMGHRSQTAESAHSGNEVDTFHVGRFNTMRMFPAAAASSGIGGAHRRTRSLYNAVSAYRAGVTSASELPLPKHRELLHRLGKDGIEKLLEEYEQATRPHSTKNSARGHRSPGPKHGAHATATPSASAAAATAAAAAHGHSMPASSPGRDRTLHPSASTRRLDMLFEPQVSARNLLARGAHRRAPAHHHMVGGLHYPHFLSPHSSQRDGRQRSAGESLSEPAMDWPSAAKQSRSPRMYSSGAPVGLGSHSPLITPNASPVPSAIPFVPVNHARTASEQMSLGGIQEEDEISPPAISMTQQQAQAQMRGQSGALAAAPTRAEAASSSPKRDADGVVVPAHEREVESGSDDADLHVKFYDVSPSDAAVAPDASADADAVCTTKALPHDPAVQTPTSVALAPETPAPSADSKVVPAVPILPSAEGDLADEDRAKSPPSVIMRGNNVSPADKSEKLTGTNGPTNSASVPAGQARVHYDKADTGDVRTDQLTKSGSESGTANGTANVHTPGVLPVARDLPWIPQQFYHLLERQCLKCLRGINDIVFDMVLTTAVGLAIGLIFGGVWSLSAYGNICVLAVLALGVLSCVSALKMFGNDRIVFWRESSAGVSVTAYWLAVTLLHLPFTLIFSFLYVAPYYNLILPGVPFVQTWWVMIGVHFACSGGGMLLSVCFAPISALLSGVMLPLIIGGFLNGVSPPLSEMSSTLRFFASLSYSRYGVEALMLQELHAQPDYAHIIVDEMVDDIGFNLGNFEFAIGMLFTIGCVLRFCTLIALHGLNRDKRI